MNCQCHCHCGGMFLKDQKACNHTFRDKNKKCWHCDRGTGSRIYTMNEEKKYHGICYECGVTANVLTCLKKYGHPPKKLKSTISTYTIGICDNCGRETEVTEIRDFFHPDFSLIEKTAAMLQQSDEQN